MYRAHLSFSFSARTYIMSAESGNNLHLDKEDLFGNGKAVLSRTAAANGPAKPWGKTNTNERQITSRSESSLESKSARAKLCTKKAALYIKRRARFEAMSDNPSK